MTKIPIHVNCENVTDPVAQIQHYEPRLHIKMNPPGKPNITNYTISWSPGHPFSDILPDYAFQLQFKQKDQRWEDVDPVTILNEKTQEQLNEEALEKGKSYQVRVRVGVPPQDEGYKGEWSHWSPTTSWRSEVGRELTRGKVTAPNISSKVQGCNVLWGLLSEFWASHTEFRREPPIHCFSHKAFSEFNRLSVVPRKNKIGIGQVYVYLV
uniref:Fibronectin type-III domain-containing protein n=1 Tax=Anguilla anguilla TaxID=7936 RepID=A0A0E9WSC7_ANGAN